ncbi:MAG: carbamoyl-phosphate synthase large subunit [Gammaproteobacteria bacterium]|nr:carbamoyl-phosphate synthase large subunit [Gammaproteobacteria bacterium]
MPRRPDLKKVMIIGAGPIVIGQACEFDYSGVQAVRALREEGIEVVVVNSNPATIMTDPDFAEGVYIEPITPDTVARIIAREKPQALLPTMGGQTALNCSLMLHRQGVLQRENVELIGASVDAINCAENRADFRRAMVEIGLKVPEAHAISSLDEAIAAAEKMTYPVIVRASYTLGGSGGGVACNRDELLQKADYALSLSGKGTVLLEQSLTGWKEFEMEVVRDKNDNCIIVCSIENIDPMGVHTGDSITVSPAQTLTDKQYQQMRTASIAVLRRIGVETGGSNVQFAVHPGTGEMLVIEMNPRVSRSSALASKATGFPIAKVAAKLAIGYTLDELRNEITGGTVPASFEPAIDYVVVKIPRFAFEKFVTESRTLTTSMQSIGEAMAIGKSFSEAMMKAISALETDQLGLGGVLTQAPTRAGASEDKGLPLTMSAELEAGLSIPTPDTIHFVADAVSAGFGLEQIYQLCHIDMWFLRGLADLTVLQNQLQTMRLDDISTASMRRFKENGFSDRVMASGLGCTEEELAATRRRLQVEAVYRNVDSCAAEFAASSSYMYSTYSTHCELSPGGSRSVLIIGAGPNRIGQGIEFDYCCVHAVLALREAGYTTIMINSNPETVSTDYDTADRLYFDPVSLEHISQVYQSEKSIGAIVQYGGQTPLSLAEALSRRGINVLGTAPEVIGRCEDRGQFKQMMQSLGIRQPRNEIIACLEDCENLADKVPYPLVVRPSFVLGGRGMEIVYDADQLYDYARRVFRQLTSEQNRVILLDEFLEDGIEVDVDVVSDGRRVFIGGIMEHIERAGIHSGDSACCLPACTLSTAIQRELADISTRIVSSNDIVGLCNIQYVVRDREIYVLEVNPRASRTVPFVSKAIGIPLAKVGALCMLGKSLDELNIPKTIRVPGLYCVKESVLPFDRFRESDALLGPEMRSTGEVMGIGLLFGIAYGKAQTGAGMVLPRQGSVLLSIRKTDKPRIGDIATVLNELGYTLYGTGGTAHAVQALGIECRVVKKVLQGQPNVVDLIRNNQVEMVINTTEGSESIRDSYAIRRAALEQRIPLYTTLAAAEASCLALKAMDAFEPVRLDDLHRTVTDAPE